jgi:hypothetical protein
VARGKPGAKWWRPSKQVLAGQTVVRHGSTEPLVQVELVFPEDAAPLVALCKAGL